MEKTLELGASQLGTREGDSLVTTCSYLLIIASLSKAGQTVRDNHLLSCELNLILFTSCALGERLSTKFWFCLSQFIVVCAL